MLITERLGHDLWHLVVGKHRRLTLLQTGFLGLQLIDSIEHIHRCGFIHRDIKPGNIMLGMGSDASKLFLIDYGLAKKVVSHSTEKMIIKDSYSKVFLFYFFIFRFVQKILRLHLLLSI